MSITPPPLPQLEMPRIAIVQSSSFFDKRPFHISGDPSGDITLLQKLGDNGWKRLQTFKTAYLPASGSSGVKPLVHRSLLGFTRFMGILELQNRVKPSVFLTDSGYLALTMRDSSGKAIDMEFVHDGIEFYIESSDKEGSVTYEISELRALAASFS